MDLFQLTYFIEVAHKKSFTKASKSLHISQPSISKGIKALEEQWGIRLFNRNGRSVSLTEKGMFLLPKIEELVAGFSHLEEQLESPDLFGSGTLAVGIPPMIGSSFISPFISYFMKEYPDIELELTEVGSNQIVDAIDAGTLQTGFVALPISTDIPYDFYIFNEENLQVVVWPEHPLSKRKKLSLNDIKDEPLVYYPKSFSLNPFIRSYYQKIMVQPKIVCQSSNWDFIVEMVRSHLGIALLPKSICQRIPSETAVSIPLTDPKIPWILAMIWKSNGFLSHSTKIWVRTFKEFYETNKSEK